MLNLPPLPPQFQCLDRDRPIKVYRRGLPHWRQDGATYFVTFRLVDSLPQERLRYLKRVREEWERKHPPPHTAKDWESLERVSTSHVEAWLDEGLGNCHFRNRQLVDDLVGRLNHFQNDRYFLSCWTIMPNHVHLAMRPFDGHDLEDLIGAIKGVSARHLNLAIKESGDVWQDESYDRLIRDGEHLWRVIQYIGRNPRKAGLAGEESWRRWIHPEWEKAGWGFRNEN
ncbi:MAG: transposase [Planctomycetaceae bacterium]|nr:transposase [Planctomycetaceae bacterium]